VRTLVRLIWGDVDRALLPLLAVATCGTAAGTTMFPFLGVFALEKLGASEIELSIAFLGGAIASVAAGYLGGHLSDHIGRRPILLTTAAAIVALPLALLAVGHHVVVGLAIISLVGVFGSMESAAEAALISDLVAPERREAGYAAFRVASNLGVSFGPLLGGLLLLGRSWSHLFGGVAVLAAGAWIVAFRFIPSGGRYKPESAPQRSSFAVVRRDRVFLVFVGAMTLASMTYVAFDALLPISLVTSHHVAPSTWGFLVVVNPIFVTLVQLRLTRRTSKVSPALKLAVAMPLMGLPFVLLAVDDAIPVVVALVVVFVIGEMLWVPTSQTVAAELAPADIRGAYMGVFGSSAQVAWALTPFVGLQVRHAFGDGAMWDCVAGLSLVAAAAGAGAAGHVRRRR
jgi:predicted MFS family arabinose efflux permease